VSLAHSITPAEAEKWRSGAPADWADDSYGVARDLIYGMWPHDPDVRDLCRPGAARGNGVPLAAVLNDALR
jgi:hypothetical protein